MDISQYHLMGSWELMGGIMMIILWQNITTEKGEWSVRIALLQGRITQIVMTEFIKLNERLK